MKQFVATSLLLGYIMLVPFCFFGGAFSANADTMNMAGNPAHQMTNCGLPIGGCAQGTENSSADSVAHHLGVYLSISQTPLTSLSIMFTMLLVLLLVVIGLAPDVISALLSQASLRPRTQRANEPQSRIRQNILTWLSLFETSPNFA